MSRSSQMESTETKSAEREISFHLVKRQMQMQANGLHFSDNIHFLSKKSLRSFAITDMQYQASHLAI